MSAPLHLVILAAGAGKRMGHVPKCLIRVNGQSLLERLLYAAAPLKARRTVVVLGHHSDAIASAMRGWEIAKTVETVVNPLPGEDPSTSLRTGLQHLGSPTGHIDQYTPTDPAEHASTMVLLADQPMLNAADLSAVWSAFQNRTPKQQVVWPTVQGQPGHPVVMSAELALELASGEQPSLKAWRGEHPENVLLWTSTNTHHTQDLDSPEDLESLGLETGLVWQLPESAKQNQG